MKKILLIPIFFLAFQSTEAGPKDSLITLRNSADTSYEEQVLPSPGVNSFLRWNNSTGLWEWRTILNTKVDLSLENVNNTSDVNKPVSAATSALISATKSTVSGGVLWATDYGVIPGDANSDTDELQAAIDAAAALAITNGTRYTVKLPSGIILIRLTAQDPVVVGPTTFDKHCIRMRSNVNIVGAGKGVTEIRAMDSLPEDRPLLLAVTGDSTNITISDLTVNGRATERGLSGGSEDEAIDPYNYVNFEGLRVRIINTGQDGFDLDDGLDARIVDCDFYRVGGDAIHTNSTSTGGFIISGCFFEAGGILRNNIYPTQGAAIGLTESKAVTITNCRFKDNIREIHSINSEAVIDSCFIEHGEHPDGGLNVLDEPAIEIDPASTQTIRISDSFIIHTDGPGIEDRGENGVLMVSNCRIVSTAGDKNNIVATDAGRVTVQGCYLSGNYNIHLVETSQPAIINDNNFAFSNVNGVRVGESSGGFASGNKFAGVATAIGLFGNSDNWEILGNHFDAGMTAVDIFSGNGTRIIGNSGAAHYVIGTSDQLFSGNMIGNLTLQNAGCTGITFKDNIISGTVSHTGATYASNTWLHNTGAGVITQDAIGYDRVAMPEPLDPPDGSTITWLSNGTGFGDAGDIIRKTNSGGVKTVTLYDHSAATDEDP